MIELNGIANIKILMDELVENLPNKNSVLVPAVKIYEQLDLLQAYMIECGKAIQERRDPPYWHEVRETYYKSLGTQKQGGQDD